MVSIDPDLRQRVAFKEGLVCIAELRPRAAQHLVLLARQHHRDEAPPPAQANIAASLYLVKDLREVRPRVGDGIDFRHASKCTS